MFRLLLHAPWIFAAVAGSMSAAQVPRAPVVSAFAACAARQSPGLARSLMAAEIDSREERERARQLFRANRGCLNGRMVLSSRTGEVRGAVAEALLERDPNAAARLSAMRARPAERAAQAEGRRFIANYARCLADAEPVKAVRWLSTEPQSPAEGEALADFGDSLNDCMPMGFAYRIDRFDVRNHLAMRLYEIAFASEGAR